MSHYGSVLRPSNAGSFSRYPGGHSSVTRGSQLGYGGGGYQAPQARPYYGMKVTEKHVRGRETPLLKVVHTDPGGPAQKAGIMVGDVLHKFCGIELLNLAQLSMMMRSSQPGSTPLFEVDRRRTREFITVTVEGDTTGRVSPPRLRAPSPIYMHPPSPLGAASPYSPHSRTSSPSRRREAHPEARGYVREEEEDRAEEQGGRPARRPTPVAGLDIGAQPHHGPSGVPAHLGHGGHGYGGVPGYGAHGGYHGAGGFPSQGAHGGYAGAGGYHDGGAYHGAGGYPGAGGYHGEPHFGGMRPHEAFAPMYSGGPPRVTGYSPVMHGGTYAAYAPPLIV